MTVRLLLASLFVVLACGCGDRKNAEPRPAVGSGVGTSVGTAVAPTPPPAAPAITGAVVAQDGKAQGLVLQVGDQTLMVPLSKLPAGSKLCSGSTCTDAANLPLTDAKMTAMLGCPCNLLKCAPLCRPMGTSTTATSGTLEMVAPAREPGVVVGDAGGGKFTITVDDGVNPPLSFPLAGDQVWEGDQRRSVTEQLQRSGGATLRPCPCTRRECVTFCKTTGTGGDVLNPTP